MMTDTNGPFTQLALAGTLAPRLSNAKRALKDARGNGAANPCSRKNRLNDSTYLSRGPSLNALFAETKWNCPSLLKYLELRAGTRRTSMDRCAYRRQSDILGFSRPMRAKCCSRSVRACSGSCGQETSARSGSSSYECSEISESSSALASPYLPTRVIQIAASVIKRR